ncbi:mitochondrial transcription rescue factor 1 isoform X2 [Amia ocellicauda]
MRGLLQVQTLRKLSVLSSLWEGTLWHFLPRTRWSHRTVYTHQISSSRSPPVLGKKSIPPFECHPPSLLLLLVRFKGSKSSKMRGKKTQHDEEEEVDDDPENSDHEEELQDDDGLPKDYKDLEKAVQSFRYDLVLKSGLDVARNKIEDAFYNNKLRLNGQKLIKKSKTVKVGDTLDLVVGEDKDTNTVTVMRVIFKKIAGETKDAEKYKVVLRRWKHLTLPKDEAYKN